MLQYVTQWMTKLPHGHSCSAKTARDVPGNTTTEIPIGSTEDDHTSSSVQRVAVLNAMLVSVPAAASLDREEATEDDSSLRSAEVEELIPIINPHTHTSELADVAVQLLRHSKWIASGLSHAADPAPRLPSASFLSDVCRHALLPACSADWVIQINRAHKARSTTDSASAIKPGALKPTAPLPWTLPLTGPWEIPSNGQAQPPAGGYRGVLVLLLFHPLRVVRVWARDVLLRLMTSTAPRQDTRAPGVLSRDNVESAVTTLLLFASQLLCTLKHMSVLPAQISFLGYHAAPSSAIVDAVENVMQDRVHTVAEGIHHLLTVLTALDTHFERALEVLEKTPSVVAQHSSVTPLLPLLVKCRSTILLLGGSLVLNGLQGLHGGIHRDLLKALHDQKHLPQQKTSAGVDPCRASEVAMKQLLDPLNTPLSSNVPMPRSTAVMAVSIRKALAKALVHCFLDNASGLAKSREEEACRRARLEWFWTFSAALDPPTARTVTPLRAGRLRASALSRFDATDAVAPVHQDSAAVEATGRDGVGTGDALVLVPGRCAGWLLRPLLKNAEQRLQWAKAMMAAKAKPNAGTTATSTDCAASLIAVLDKAVYCAYMLLDSLATALPSLMRTTYLHDTLVAHEQQLLTLAIGGILHTRSVHALRLHRILLSADVHAFVAGAAAQEAGEAAPANTTGAGFVGVPSACLQRVWLTLPRLIVQVCKCCAACPEVDTALAKNSTTSGPLPSSEVLVHLCASLAVLTEEDATLCSQWLLMSPGKVMSRAPPPFHWVVQHCLHTLSDTLHEQQELLKQVWLGLPSMATQAAYSAAAAQAASRLLTQEKPLLRLLLSLRIAAVEDPEAGKLSEGLERVFCVGIRDSVIRTLSSEAAVWVWRCVVVTQRELRLPPPHISTVPFSPAIETAEACTVWDVDDAVLTNTARTQGRRWLVLLSQCNWEDMNAWEVQCAWWMAALLADVVTLSLEQRRTLAEQVILALPTRPMLAHSEAATHVLGSTHDASTVAAVEGPCHVLEEKGKQRLCQRSAESALHRYNVVKHLFIRVLGKAELYPRTSFAMLLLRISEALPPLLVARDVRFQQQVQPLLVRLCSRSPDVQQHLAEHGAMWLRRGTEQVTRTVNECLAEQERRFRQFEMEESTLLRDEADAAQRAIAAHRLQRLNEVERIGELDRQQASTRHTAVSAIPTAESSLDANDLLIHSPNSTRSRQSNPSCAGAESRVRALSQEPLFSDRLSSRFELKKRRSSTSGGDGSTALEAIDVDTDTEYAMATALKVQPSDCNRGPPQTSSRTPSPAPLPVSVSPLKVPKTLPTTGVATITPTGPTLLDTKLQEINARNTHRFCQCESLAQFNARLKQLATRTNPDYVRPPLICDIIGSTSECMACDVPLLPEVFVPESASLPLDDAAREYTTRFALHIALELRYSIACGYEGFLYGACKGGRVTDADPSRPCRASVTTPTVPVDVKAPTDSMNCVLDSLLPLHPGIMSACLEVQCIEEIKWAFQSHWFSVRACAPPTVDDYSQKMRQRAHGQASTAKSATAPWSINTEAVGSTVVAAAEPDPYTTLSQGDVVAVLLPLRAPLERYLESNLGCTLVEASAAELTRHAQEMIDRLPRSWRTLGCAVQVYHIQALQKWERTADLCGSTSVVERSFSSHEPPSLRFLHVFRMAYNTQTSPTFYIAKLASLRGCLMELQALYNIDCTHFAATLYDPRSTAPVSLAFYDWATSLLSAAGPSLTTRLVDQLRKRLLLHEKPNSWQIRAIVAILYAACPGWDEGVAEKTLQAPVPRAPELLLMEGPPGTGKTQTIGLLILNLLHHLSYARQRAPRILVCAPSNRAVDEALLRVVRLREQLGSTEPGPKQRPAHAVLAGRLLRIGLREKVDTEVLRLPEPVFLEDIVDVEMNGPSAAAWALRREEANNKKGLMYIQEKRETVSKKAFSKALGSAAVVFSTLGSLHHVTNKASNLMFDIVIVDEASQGTEPAVVQALTLAEGKCVLVGDSRQLQPTVLSREASRCGLRRSLLVRLLACGNHSFLLRTQYRMHPDIVAFPNKIFYGSNLVTDARVLARFGVPDGHAAAATTIAQKLGRCPRFVFVDVSDSKMERQPSGSLFNCREAAVLVNCMRQLRAHLKMTEEEMAAHLGIITFYTAQRYEILSMLTLHEIKSGVQVATVDSFQGKEKSIILLSCVRTPSPAQLQRLTQRVQLMEADHNSDGGGSTAGEGPGADDGLGRYEIGFLADWRRLNVALTRAQDLCVCFASKDVLRAVGMSSMPSAQPPCADSRVDSLSKVVNGQLLADDADPLVLYRMLVHAETHDPTVRRQETQPVQLNTSTTPTVSVDDRRATRPRAACITHHPRMNLPRELMARAKAAEAQDAHLGTP
ncbi:hypothetical protein JKF63_06922 [Porcisia hertigi]|uniref:Uncharacterized protein n=1 Tax=Porcisia hertigi TaxID=2761500 RepID=A0A836LJC7_9TRYP|nr:hypothetical protein JKF63_06922 [Porcisia hertigi]